MYLQTSIDDLPSTSVITKKRFRSIGINTYRDLINYFPFRYENYSLHSTIKRLQPGEVVTLRGTIEKAKFEITRKGKKIQKVILNDGTDTIDLVWYNQPYLLRLFRPSQNLSASGEVKSFQNKLTIEPQSYELLNNPKQRTIHTGRLVPVYSEQRGLSSRVIREKIYTILSLLTDESLTEFLPGEILNYNHLIDEFEAYQQIHFPNDIASANKARGRLAFDELFVIQLAAKLIRNEWQKEIVGNPFRIGLVEDQKLKEFIDDLPFQLTDAQKRTVKEIISDLKKPSPMNRFLEGDVGSGKTVVATVAAYLSYLNNYQTVFMAPTEILAFQHYNTLSRLLKSYPLKVGLQTGTKKVANTTEHYDILVGTHALISGKFSLDMIGLTIIDEQHRFGVVQRASLKEKGINPHLLTMTATPIPRTVALTLYGELDLSVIDEMPRGRLPVKTVLVTKNKRLRGYEWIKKQIKGEQVQVFIICPLIEESDVETMKSVKAATKEYERLQKEIFPGFNLGLLHGKLKSKEKNQIMEDFKAKKYDILVSTPVVEVGIDIPSATIMVIEAAERFGLAQLHQLRGRVGRGSKQSYCLLYTESTDKKVVERLQTFTKIQSGMQLAEYDLKLRGPGEIYGVSQHGYQDLKIASLADYELIDGTKRAVKYFMQKYSNIAEFPEIERRVEAYKVRKISRD